MGSDDLGEEKQNTPFGVSSKQSMRWGMGCVYVALVLWISLTGLPELGGSVSGLITHHSAVPHSMGLQVPAGGSASEGSRVLPWAQCWLGKVPMLTHKCATKELSSYSRDF